MSDENGGTSAVGVAKGVVMDDETRSAVRYGAPPSSVEQSAAAAATEAPRRANKEPQEIFTRFQSPLRARRQNEVKQSPTPSAARLVGAFLPLVGRIR